MPASRFARIIGALLAAGSVVAFGAACAPESPHREKQTVASACTAVADTVGNAMAVFTEADAADPTAAATATAGARDQLEKLTRSIDNDRVGAVVADLAAGFDVLADATSAAADGDVDGVTGLSEATDRIRSGVSEYHDLCAG
ncbi:hypothetical protein [Microbacterium oleivorans]|uniref:hypothetical protein n=1 Tax=Microbacterium oleivorans TaxID=273677 RepID=UPI00080DE2FC|nr:hypothetical protein [Microbacterium oleivorans]